ncbi:MAG: hypothetical protein JJU36_10805 [Phycisphaeraceae bacterium]|nr:hypothetical protein [Phycisphaeraceae bacterium]
MMYQYRRVRIALVVRPCGMRYSNQALVRGWYSPPVSSGQNDRPCTPAEIFHSRRIQHRRHHIDPFDQLIAPMTGWRSAGQREDQGLRAQLPKPGGPFRT